MIQVFSIFCLERDLAQQRDDQYFIDKNINNLLKLSAILFEDLIWDKI